MENAVFSVPSISCSVCAGKIKQGLAQVAGVQNVTVDLKSQQVAIDYDDALINKNHISSKITSLGYEVI